MTAEQIVEDWLDKPENRAHIGTIAYEKEVYEFIIATCARYTFSNGNDVVYNVNGNYQYIILKP